MPLRSLFLAQQQRRTNFTHRHLSLLPCGTQIPEAQSLTKPGDVSLLIPQWPLARDVSFCIMAG